MTIPSATLSLTSEEDEIIIPDDITAISYSFTEDGESITRQIAVEPTDKVKYYKEEDGYYTLAIYGSDGAIKSKGYTLHSDDIPNIDITYSADVNNGFTESDEYVEFVPTTTVRIENPSNIKYTERATIPQGITKIRYYAFIKLSATNSTLVLEDCIMNLSGDDTSIVVDYFFNSSNVLNTKVYIDNNVYTTYNNLATLEITYGTSINRS